MKRDEIPELWGPGEIIDFARSTVREAGADISDRNVTRWLSLPEFPEPVVTLKMGPVFLADDVKPWVIDRLSRSRIRPGRVGNAIAEETRKEVADAYGRMSQAEAAAAFGVSPTTVWKIWSDVRRRSQSSES